MVKPSEDHSVSVKPSGLTPISVNTQSQLPEEVPEMKRRVTRPDLLRINRFLLGERREKSDLAPLPERKRTRVHTKLDHLCLFVRSFFVLILCL